MPVSSESSVSVMSRRSRRRFSRGPTASRVRSSSSVTLRFCHLAITFANLRGRKSCWFQLVKGEANGRRSKGRGCRRRRGGRAERGADAGAGPPPGDGGGRGRAAERAGRRGACPAGAGRGEPGGTAGARPGQIGRAHV